MAIPVIRLPLAPLCYEAARGPHIWLRGVHSPIIVQILWGSAPCTCAGQCLFVLRPSDWVIIPEAPKFVPGPCLRESYQFFRVSTPRDVQFMTRQIPRRWDRQGRGPRFWQDRHYRQTWPAWGICRLSFNCLEVRIMLAIPSYRGMPSVHKQSY